MRAIMVMFDSLNRHMLPNYGCDFVHAPNFERLGRKTVTFDNCYAGSLPCMPARRELHTGRYNFLHRSWGPIEPYDDSMPEILKNNGIYTHLISDHAHYWEDGGATYHTRYSSWEINRGQEGDPWKGEVHDPEIPEDEFAALPSPLKRQDIINRKYMDNESKQPQAKTFKKGIDFIKTNKNSDNWFLQIETFDPHEPFFTQQPYKDIYPHKYDGKPFDWPPYYFVQEDEQAVQHGRYQYAALLSMCDKYLGKVLDVMDANDMWKDTMLIVNTDHGYLLGEHGWWSKTVMPVYNEIAHIPLFIWDPRLKICRERRKALVQTIDLPATLLEFFDIGIPKDMDGRPLKNTIIDDRPVRKAALFGIHGGHVNCTDGRYVYMRSADNMENLPLYEYTLMPTHMRQMFSVSELQDIRLREPFKFTKECKLMQIKANGFQSVNSFNYGSKLFDLKNDPSQNVELDDPDIEIQMIKIMADLMKKNDSPREQFKRLGIPENGIVTREELLRQRDSIRHSTDIDLGKEVYWDEAAKSEFWAFLLMNPESNRSGLINSFCEFIGGTDAPKIVEKTVLDFIKSIVPDNKFIAMAYYLRLAARKK